MKYLRGFTVVELAIVVAVLAVLVVIGLFSWTSWQRTLLESELKIELESVATAMDQHRNFNDSYPLSIPPSHNKGKNALLTYVSGSETTYCIEAASLGDLDIVYKVSDGVVSKGGC